MIEVPAPRLYGPGRRGLELSDLSELKRTGFIFHEMGPSGVTVSIMGSRAAAETDTATILSSLASFLQVPLSFLCSHSLLCVFRLPPQKKNIPLPQSHTLC